MAEIIDFLKNKDNKITLTEEQKILNSTIFKNSVLGATLILPIVNPGLYGFGMAFSTIAGTYTFSLCKGTTVVGIVTVNTATFEIGVKVPDEQSYAGITAPNLGPTPVGYYFFINGPQVIILGVGAGPICALINYCECAKFAEVDNIIWPDDANPPAVQWTTSAEFNSVYSSKNGYQAAVNMLSNLNDVGQTLGNSTLVCDVPFPDWQIVLIIFLPLTILLLILAIVYGCMYSRIKKSFK